MIPEHMLAQMPADQMSRIKLLIFPATLRSRSAELEKEVHEDYKLSTKTAMGTIALRCH